MIIYLTARQAAEHLSVTTRTLRTWCADGRLPAHYTDGAVYYSVNDINALIQSTHIP